MTTVRRLIFPLLVCALAPPLARAADWRCGTSPGGERELRLLHQMRTDGRSGAATATRRADVDVGDVAVVVDQGDLIVRRNPFDLDGTAIRLTPDRSGGYAVARVAIPIEPPGTSLALGNDDARAVELGFEFPFSGTN